MAWGQPAEEPQSIPNTVDPAELTNPLDAAQGGTVEVEVHEKVEETEEQRKRRQDAEVQTWLDAKTEAAKWKDEEMQARTVVSSSFFPTPKKGTQYAPLGGGWRIKLVHGWNYKLGDSGRIGDDGLAVSIETQVRELEAKIEALGPEGAMIVNRVIRWKPELSATEYLRLADESSTDIEKEAFELVTAMLEISPKSPTLDMVEPPKPKTR